MSDERGMAEAAGLPVSTAGESLHVRRVFGEGYEQEGVLVIPVAKLTGGSGMGFGSGALADGSSSGTAVAPASGVGSGEGAGGGGGFGLRVKPLGVYRVSGGHVTWHPAIDVNRAIIGGQALGAVAVAAAAWVLRRRRRSR